MLRTLGKLVLKRNRDAREGPGGLIEEDGPTGQSNNSDDALQSAGQELEQPSGPPVRGMVKWFSPIKGYGFVVLSHGSGDAFLHASALAGIGITNLQPGETLEFRVTLGQRGPQVTEVISVDRSTAAPARPRRELRVATRPTAFGGARPGDGNGEVYNSTKGFGFMVLDGRGKEVFVHSSALKRAGITRLNERQRVFVGVAEGRKGLEALSVQVISSGSDNV